MAVVRAAIDWTFFLTGRIRNTRTDGVREEPLLLRDLENQSHAGETSARHGTKRTGGFFVMQRSHQADKYT